MKKILSIILSILIIFSIIPGVVIADGELLADDTPAKILTNEEIAAKAYLKKTSLYDLAVKCDIAEPAALVDRFIYFEKCTKRNERRE